jgi:hypothetical protein
MKYLNKATMAGDHTLQFNGAVLLLVLVLLFQQSSETMKVAVWDTYVKRKNGTIMHFDIIVPATLKDAQKVYSYGNEYLKTKNEFNQPLTAKECKFCHVEYIKPQWEEAIKKNGYYIFEMENCE